MSIRICLCLAVLGTGVAEVRSQQSQGRSPNQRSRVVEVDPVRDPIGHPFHRPASFPNEFRSIDGSGNNAQSPEWGAADRAMRRLVAPIYADATHDPSGPGRPNARSVSNAVAAQVGSIPNSQGVSDFVWMWGQFLDHDIVETPIASPAEPFDIRVPAGDPWFDPNGTGLMTISLDRSGYQVILGVRQQMNFITAFIDASNVYGSDDARARELRTLDGTGRLKTSLGNLLPFNVNGLVNAPSTAPSFFLAGDIRANEQVALTAMHTLFVREHNYWAERIAELGIFDDETIYQLVRGIVAGEMQAITYREFLPVLLGPGAIAPFQGYRSKVDPTIANAFATAAYRFGHSMLSPQLLRVGANGSTHSLGHLSLAQAFFNPTEIVAIGIDPYLRGLSMQRAQEVDPYVIDEVRNFLFGPPGAGGFDLASLNIQRGRDHGLPFYNDVRRGMGRARARSFADVSSDLEIRRRLSLVYGSVDDIDLWVGLLCEDHAGEALVGKTLSTILIDQFARLRDGDRFWYQAYMPPAMIDFLHHQTLATIIRRNTGIGRELPDDVFHVAVVKSDIGVRPLISR